MTQVYLANTNGIKKDDIVFGNKLPLILIAGLNVLEDEALAFDAARELVAQSDRLGLPFIFKASFDKANRSSISSYRGPGLTVGLGILQAIKKHFGCPIITDIHTEEQAEAVADVVDIIQIPAFLARQTDLVVAAAKTGRVINVKKPQFLAPQEMVHIIRKINDCGNSGVLLCERGTSFGYNNLVVDTLGIDIMKPMAPIIMDVTHALQKPGALIDRADGRSAQIMPLTRATVALGLAGLFLEIHPSPDKAKCDGPCALPIVKLGNYLEQVVALDRLIKNLPAF